MEKILYRMCAYTHSDQFGKITVDRGFVNLARRLAGCSSPSGCTRSRDTGFTASDPLWKSGLLGKQVRWCTNDHLDADPGPPPRA